MCPTANQVLIISNIARSFLLRLIANIAFTLHLVLLSERGCINTLKVDSASAKPVINQGFNLYELFYDLFWLERTFT